MSKTSFFDRMMQYANSQGIKNPSQLTEMLGYSRPERLLRLGRDENAKPSYDILVDLTNTFENLPLRWLLTGENHSLPAHTPGQTDGPLVLAVEPDAHTPHARMGSASPNHADYASPAASPAAYKDEIIAAKEEVIAQLKETIKAKDQVIEQLTFRSVE